MRDKETIKAGSVFITHRTREAINKAAAQRTEPELKECFAVLHDSMDRFGKQIAVEEITGQDFIIYTRKRNRKNRGGVIFSPRIQYALFG